MTAPPKPVSGQDGFFWKTKTLEEMSDAEWESLCDGCARCCLEKLEDEDTSKIYFTHVSCKLLDAGLCTCKDYLALCTLHLPAHGVPGFMNLVGIAGNELMPSMKVSPLLGRV